MVEAAKSVKLSLEVMKLWLDGHPGHREIKIEFRSLGVYVCLRQLSLTADKIEWAFAWDDLLFSNIEMLELKLCQLREKMQ